MDLPSIAVLEPGFSLEPTQEGDRIVVRFAGNADMSAVKTLGSCLKRLHEEAAGNGMRDVLCDFTGLYFMNSSCFKAFVTWITTVEMLEEQVRYRIRFRSNPQLHWQKRSLEALRCLAEGVVVVDSEA